jgi:hypothetical protein
MIWACERVRDNDCAIQWCTRLMRALVASIDGFIAARYRAQCSRRDLAERAEDRSLRRLLPRRAPPCTGCLLCTASRQWPVPDER